MTRPKPLRNNFTTHPYNHKDMDPQTHTEEEKVNLNQLAQIAAPQREEAEEAAEEKARGES